MRGEFSWDEFSGEGSGGGGGLLIDFEGSDK